MQNWRLVNIYLLKVLTFIINKTVFLRFVMYQMSKNLNRPFFIEVLTEISVKFAKDGLEVKEDDEEDTGDNILTMLLKPSYTTQDSSKTQHDENFFHESEGGS